MSYSSIHNHTFFSLLDGFSSPKEYFEKATELGLKSLCITEHANVYSQPYIMKLEKEYPELKVLYGCEIYEAKDRFEKDKDNKYWHLILICKNNQGRIDLNKIISESNINGFYYKNRIDLEYIKPFGKNLIATSACLASKLSREQDYEICKNYIKEYKEIFSEFYLEMQSHKSEDQINYNKKILQLSKDTNTSFIITTDSHVINEQDLEYQKYHVMTARDMETMDEIYEGCYMQSEEQIHKIMDCQIGYENVCIGLDNTNKLSNNCEKINPIFSEPKLPNFEIPKEFKSQFEYLEHLCEIGWVKRKINSMKQEDINIRKKRLNYELSVIKNMDFVGYFLIVQDYINWAKDNNIAVGDGRGSGAGSIVNMLIGITNIDPIKYNLLFERFLNPERIGMPDIDSDVSDRAKVFEYLANKYGEENVFQIMNFSYISPIMAIRDVSKTLKIPYKNAQEIAKQFTDETIDETLKNKPELLIQYPQYYDLFRIASKIDGRIRNVATTAGGIGIVDGNVNNYLPVRVDDKNLFTIQCDKRICEEIGIVKMDLLGVKTLTLIDETRKDVGLSKWDIDINNPKFEYDVKAYEILQIGDTDGIFQCEGTGLTELCQRIKPNTLLEISDIISLFRPDTMRFIEDYIKNKHGNEEVNKYIHEDMGEILDKHYRVMIYQENLMEIVRKFGGRTMGGSDLFRKGVGKKDKKLVKKESATLKDEIINNGYSKEVAIQISEMLAECGGYLFNLSHGVAYSVLTLQTAYLKSHYPIYFYKNLLNINKSDNGKLNKYLLSAKKHNIEILHPDINKSIIDFSVLDDKIIFGISTICGIGEKVVEKIIEERNINKFKNITDLKNRTGLNIAQLVILIKSGALPTKDKKQSLFNLAKEKFEIREFKEVKGFCGNTIVNLKEKYNIETKNKEERLKLFNIEKKKEFDKLEDLRYNSYMQDFYEKYMQNEQFWEFEGLNIFINNNPFEEIYDYVMPFEKVEDDGYAVVVGIISNIVKKKDKNKKQFAYITVYSAFGIIEMICWHTQLKTYEELIAKGNKVAVKCKKKEGKAMVNAIKTFEQWKIDQNIMIIS